MTTTPMASIGVDIGKAVFHVVGFGSDGKIAFRRKIKRLALLEAFKLPPPSIVGMEACLSAHFVSRALRQLGHQPRLIPAIYVKPFMKGFPVGSPSLRCTAMSLGPRPSTGWLLNLVSGQRLVTCDLSCIER